MLRRRRRKKSSSSNNPPKANGNDNRAISDLTEDRGGSSVDDSKNDSDSVEDNSNVMDDGSIRDHSDSVDNNSSTAPTPVQSNRKMAADQEPNTEEKKAGRSAYDFLRPAAAAVPAAATPAGAGAPEEDGSGASSSAADTPGAGGGTGGTGTEEQSAVAEENKSSSSHAGDEDSPAVGAVAAAIAAGGDNDDDDNDNDAGEEKKTEESSSPPPPPSDEHTSANAAVAADAVASGDPAADDVDDDAKNMVPPVSVTKSSPPSLALSSSSTTSTSTSYRVAKWTILRLLGLVYFVAFLGAYHQNMGLMGSAGLQPAAMDRMLESYNDNTSSSRWEGFRNHPTIFWWIPLDDVSLQAVTVLGLVGSALVAFGGVNSWLLQLLLWLLDFSLVTVAAGSSFYAYGWESQLLETGFLAVFLCALPSLTVGRNGRPRFRLNLWEGRRTQSTSISGSGDDDDNSNSSTPSPIILWLFRWLCFRISIGAGLIKLRGSSCWTQKTCLHYHFETQPVPSPLSFAYHFLPPTIQRHMVDVDLFVQVYASAFVLLPLEWIPSRSLPRLYRAARNVLRISGVVQAGFMVAIILSGNFAFLNHLTIIPALACFDDDFVPQRLRNVVTTGRLTATPQPPPPPPPPPQPSTVDGQSTSSKLSTWLKPSRRWLDLGLLLWILFLSRPVVDNLLQRSGQRQVMNTSFDPFRIVNTYGAFGSVGEARYEAILQISDGPVNKPWGVTNNTTADNGTAATTVVMDAQGYPVQNWTELEFPCKPGNVTRRPCFCAPYHYRLDWNIWFLGFKPHHDMLRRRESWLYALLAKILQPPPKPDGSGGDDKLPQQQQPWLALLDRDTATRLYENYYRRGKAPKVIRVDMYRYRMSKSLWAILWDYYLVAVGKKKDGDGVVWWTRKYEENLVPPVLLDHSTRKLQLAYPV